MVSLASIISWRTWRWSWIFPGCQDGGRPRRQEVSDSCRSFLALAAWGGLTEEAFLSKTKPEPKPSQTWRLVLQVSQTRASLLNDSCLQMFHHP